MEVSWLGWTLTIGLIVALLALDLVLGILRPHAVALTEAARWSAFYVVVAVAFGVLLATQVGWEYGTQYFAGYIVEKSLSVDNLFVFVVIVSTFATPREYQKEALAFGIILALIVRAIFIALGAALLSLFSFTFLLFGLLLVWSAIQLFRHRNEQREAGNSRLIRLARRVLPVSRHYVGGRLLARVGGRLVATPLLLVLLAIGATDILFALDSIPAVFGLTNEPFIVFTANAFALLGLRALYFLVGGLLSRLIYLSSGLALILVFIGIKLILHWAHGVDDRVPLLPTGLSLAFIAFVLAVTTVASIAKSRRRAASVAGAARRRPVQAGQKPSVPLVRSRR